LIVTPLDLSRLAAELRIFIRIHILSVIFDIFSSVPIFQMTLLQRLRKKWVTRSGFLPVISFLSVSAPEISLANIVWIRRMLQKSSLSFASTWGLA
jgi:hypothetical protein